jgi:aminoglycoside phosphotransferase (APT) family kinase protein
MRELTVENALDYLRRQGWIGPGPATVELLGGGVSNAVLLVEAGDRRFVLKQSRPQLRTRDAWFSDVARIWREQEVMQALRPLLPAGVAPATLHIDRDNYVFAMEAAPRESRVWKEMLLAGEIDRERGRLAGVILGRIHEGTARNPELIAPFADRTVFVQLRVEPYYQRIGQRRPEVADAIKPIVAELMTRSEALCHGDFSPKNLLAHPAGFTLVDYETGHRGDPTMDLGFFLTHLVLKTVKRSHDAGRHLDLIDAFWEGYESEVRWRPLAELRARAIPHLAVCLLVRIDGTSPVDYLPEEDKREHVRRVARTLLRDRVVEWRQVRELVAG